MLACEPSDSAFEVLIRAHYHYRSIVPRLNGYKSEIRLSLRWADGFRTSKVNISNDLFLDWACILWNMGALESQLGAKIERSSEDGIKAAYKHFQQAAGYFDFILSQVLPKCAPNVLCGLSTVGLGMARDLMLAQAQLCFYEKVLLS